MPASSSFFNFFFKFDSQLASPGDSAAGFESLAHSTYRALVQSGLALRVARASRPRRESRRVVPSRPAGAARFTPTAHSKTPTLQGCGGGGGGRLRSAPPAGPPPPPPQPIRNTGKRLRAWQVSPAQLPAAASANASVSPQSRRRRVVQAQGRRRAPSSRQQGSRGGGGGTDISRATAGGGTGPSLVVSAERHHLTTPPPPHVA